MLPANVWRLEDGQLHDARSPGSLALGVVAPLWDHAGGYVFSFTSLGIPLLVLWLLWRSPESRRRTLLLTLVGLAAVPYVELHTRICDALRGSRPRVVMEAWGGDGSVRVKMEDGSWRVLTPEEVKMGRAEPPS